MIGEVVKLDRKFPLVTLEDGRRVRCEHATDLKKHGAARAVIGDIVEVELPDGHDVGVIAAIRPRTTTFVRKDPTERMVPQVLAANFDHVFVVQPADGLNLKRLERELVLAHETGAAVAVVLTKGDLLGGGTEAAAAIKQVRDLAGPTVPVLMMARNDEESIKAVRRLIGDGTAVLIGRSGAGKSTMVNILSGEDARATSEVRARDGKGRHKTVSREIVPLASGKGEGGASARARGGRVIDMPGVRGLGLWDADDGIAGTFADIEELAAQCRFRDCRHDSEPGCAVRAAVEDGRIAPSRLESYRSLQQELANNNRRRQQSTWKNR